MLAAGIVTLMLCAVFGWWGRPVLGVVSPRIQGYDFYFSSTMFMLFLTAVALIGVGIARL